MQDLSDNIKAKKSILLSRNTPIALVVGAAGFLGSHLVDELVKKNIQIFGIDDLSSGKINYLEIAIKNRNFHFLNSSINGTKESFFQVNLPRLDYAIFCIDLVNNEHISLLIDGLQKFLQICKNKKINKPPKILFISKIKIYDAEHKLHFRNDLKLQEYRKAEIFFAKYVKENNLNGRLVRLSALFGERMHFREEDPITYLIEQKILGNIKKDNTSLEFSTNALYVKDAIELIIKTLFLENTHLKIFDGTRPIPVKVYEIKEALVKIEDNQSYQFSQIPENLTPNLQKTIIELKWQPHPDYFTQLKETINYFKKNPITSDYQVNLAMENKWKDKTLNEVFDGNKQDMADNEKKVKKEMLNFKTILGISSLGLFLSLLVVVFISIYSLNKINSNLNLTYQYYSNGDLTSAKTTLAKNNHYLNFLEQGLGFTEMLKKLNINNVFITDLSNLKNSIKEGNDGVEYSLEALEPSLTKNQSKLKIALEKFTKIKIQSLDQPIIKKPFEEFKKNINNFEGLAESINIFSEIYPILIAQNLDSNYLILFQNNFILRPTGGLLETYSIVNLSSGKITGIKIEDIDKLDSPIFNLELPNQIKNDLLNGYRVKDLNYDPNLVIIANNLKNLYKDKFQENVNGVILIDFNFLQELSKLANKEADYNQLFNLLKEGSRDEYKARLISLQQTLYPKLFNLEFIKNSNFIIFFNKLIKEKHIAFEFGNENFNKTLGANNEQGYYEDYLIVNESNLEENNANLSLKRSFSINTFLDENQVKTDLKINYSTKDLRYKFRLRVFVPIGTQLKKAILGDNNILNQHINYLDGQKNAYSFLVLINQHENIILNLEFETNISFEFKDQELVYNQYFIKQAGTNADEINIRLIPVSNLEIESFDSKLYKKDQSLNLNTNLSTDLNYWIKLKNNSPR